MNNKMLEYNITINNNPMEDEDYFSDKTVSNSTLRNFISYDKYWNRIITADKYDAYEKDKVEFKPTDAIVIGKAVDEFFDKSSLFFLNRDALFKKYEPVARRTKSPTKDYVQITNWMFDTVNEMIEWWLAFDSFQSFINDENTKAQQKLKKNIELLDTKTGEIIELQIKWLPDYINESNKKICDLKTTGSIQMITDSLQFRWKPILTSDYIRQQAIYNKLLWGWYDGSIA